MLLAQIAPIACGSADKLHVLWFICYSSGGLRIISACLELSGYKYYTSLSDPTHIIIRKSKEKLHYLAIALHVRII